MRQLLILLFSVLSCTVQAQTTTYKIKNVGYITIPNEMELQGGKYGDFLRKQAKNFPIEIDFDNQVVFQQKGLNNLSEAGFSSYARIIIETEYGDYGYDTRMTPEEQKELSLAYKNKMQSLRQYGLKLLNWYGVSRSNIGGKNAIKISYTRQLNSNPTVYVVIYMILQGNKLYTITFSYREKEKGKWQPLFNKVINNIKIH